MTRNMRTATDPTAATDLVNKHAHAHRRHAARQARWLRELLCHRLKKGSLPTKSAAAAAAVSDGQSSTSAACTVHFVWLALPGWEAKDKAISLRETMSDSSSY